MKEIESVYFPTHQEHNRINGTLVKGYRDERHQACLVGKQNCHVSWQDGKSSSHFTQDFLVWRWARKAGSSGGQRMGMETERDGDRDTGGNQVVWGRGALGGGSEISKGFGNHLGKCHKCQKGRNLSASHHLLYMVRKSQPRALYGGKNGAPRKSGTDLQPRKGPACWKMTSFW